MSEIWDRIQRLVGQSEIRISDHGYDELLADGILATEIVAGATEGTIIEEYPDYPKGPCVLVLQKDSAGNPVHAVWGVPRGAAGPAVLVTAYRPDPRRWADNFTRRRK